MQHAKTRHKKSTSGSSKNLKAKQRQESVRRREQRKESTITRSGFGFHPVAPKGFFSTDLPDSTGREYVTMLSDLKSGYERYCELSGVKPVAYCDNLTKDLRDMISHLRSLVHAHSKLAKLRIQHNETGYQFEIYSYFESFRSETLYVFPMMMFERLRFYDETFGDIFLQFMASVCNKMEFTYFTDSYRFEVLVRECDLRENYAEDEEGEMEWQRDMECYTKFAPLYTKKMRRIGNLFTNNKLLYSIQRLEGNCHELRDLKDWMLEGYPIMTHEDCTPIPNMQYDNELADEYVDSWNGAQDAIQLVDTFLVAWNDEDQITNQYMEWINPDSGEYGHFDPCEWMVITPALNKTYKHLEWGESFFKWFDKGFRLFNRFSDHNS